MATGTITLFEKENVLMATAENISTADWPVEAPSSTSPSSVFSEEFARRLSNVQETGIVDALFRTLKLEPTDALFSLGSRQDGSSEATARRPLNVQGTIIADTSSLLCVQYTISLLCIMCMH